MDYILRGPRHILIFRTNTRERFDESIRFFERALALDASSVDARSYLGQALVGRVLDLKIDSPATDIQHHVHATLAAGYALKGADEQAFTALAEARKRSDRYTSISHLKAAPGRQ